jgi:hypothetical protein
MFLMATPAGVDAADLRPIAGTPMNHPSDKSTDN